ncbi:MAG: DUF1295 domain-containing protein [Flavobacteriia bacterium]|nr:DUF1295 domain-containing protein [Flavobacteriia bacterium]
MLKKLIGLIVVTLWYAVALFSIEWVAMPIANSSPFIQEILQFPGGDANELFWLTIWMTIVVFIGSSIHRNASLYDPYWSVLPILFTLLGPVMHLFSEIGMREYFLMAVIFTWGVRLTGNWIYTWKGLHHQDWRYTELKKKTGLWYPAVNFLGIHLFPTLIVFVAYLPAVEVFGGDRPPLQFLDFIAVAIGFFGIAIQTTADIQMHRFRKRFRGQINQKGLWGWSRHPNYLGEISIWVSVFLFGISAGAPLWPTVICPLGMIALFVFISIPMMEKRQSKKDGWEKYQSNVGMLLPKIWRGKSG